MPKGKVAPGWVLPTCGFGHHHVSAMPWGTGRSVAELPMKGSTCSITGSLLSTGGVVRKPRSTPLLPDVDRVTRRAFVVPGPTARRAGEWPHAQERGRGGHRGVLRRGAGNGGRARSLVADRLAARAAPARVGATAGGRCSAGGGRGRRAGARVRPLRGGGSGHARTRRADRAPGRGRVLPVRAQPDVPRGGRGHRRPGVAAVAGGPGSLRGRGRRGVRRLRSRVRAAHAATPVRAAVRGLPARGPGVVAPAAPVAARTRTAAVAFPNGPHFLQTRRAAYGAGMSLVAGVDSSTQSCSVVVCDTETGQVLRSRRASHPSGTEVSAQAWADAYAEATGDPALLQGVEAMAVGGQQHGMVTLDSDGELVRDALLWNDNRSGPDAADLIAELGGPQAWADQVGSVPPASFTVTKLRWLARAEPDLAARTATVLLPHDWLTWQLGGRGAHPARG